MIGKLPFFVSVKNKKQLFIRNFAKY